MNTLEVSQPMLTTPIAMDHRQQFQRLGDRLGATVLGQQALVEALVLALLADGHLLVEGLPGLAKTRAIKCLSHLLTVALTTTVISTVAGTLTALALARYRFRLEGFYRVLLFMPMLMPDIVLGIALLIFFIGAGVPLGKTSIIIGHCTFLISYVFLVVSALLAFIISMDDLVITYFIAGVDSTTLPVYIYGMIRRGIKPEINAIATLLLLASLIIAALGLYLRSRQPATAKEPDHG